MKRLVWLTDLHLEFLQPEQIETFLTTVSAANPDYVLISGDIGGNKLMGILEMIEFSLQVPIYFVLGNHDYYNHSIAAVRDAVRALSLDSVYLHWLPICEVVQLTEQVGLVGHGGWSDGGYGNFMSSSVMLNDYIYIRELRGLSKSERLAALQQLGAEGANHIRKVLPLALERFQQVFVVTHSPPFIEATWHESKTPQPDDPYLPHFSCKAIGDALLEIVPQFPHRQVMVLCGHTHSTGQAQILDNLQVLTQGAEYNNPQIARLFEVD